MVKQYDPASQMVKYDGPRKVWRKGDLVFKKDPDRLGQQWRTQMERILEVWTPLAWRGFIEDGYATRYINGTDLHGNRSFEMDPSQMVVVDKSLRFEVLPIFSKVIAVGEKLGFTLGDITCGNIMVEDSRLYLIDYEVITQYPLKQDYVQVWSNTLRLIFGTETKVDITKQNHTQGDTNE